LAKLSGWRFAGVGMFAAFTQVNELPALSFLALIAGLLLFRYPRQTLLCLVPAALVPIAASLAAQYAALGEIKLVYTEFGTESYLWVFLSIPALLAVLSWLRLLRRGGEPMAAVAWMTTVLTIVLLAFYTWNPMARNHGGSTQGLRWLFWLIPFWLLVLPKGVESGQHRGWVRGLSLLALVVSVGSVGYAMRNPWSHPWILDALEHPGLYGLPR